MDQFILNHSDAIRVLSRFIIPIAIALVVVIVIIVYTTVRQKANKPLDSSNGKSRFASTYGGKNTMVSHDPERQPVQSMSVSNATRRMAEAAANPASPPQQALSRGILRQQPNQRNPRPQNQVLPREQAKPVDHSEEDGVLEFCLEYMEAYRI